MRSVFRPLGASSSSAVGFSRRAAHGSSHSIPHRQLPNPATVPSPASLQNHPPAPSVNHSSASFPPANDVADSIELEHRAPGGLTGQNLSQPSRVRPSNLRFTPKGKPIPNRSPAPSSIPLEAWSPDSTEPRRAIDPSHPLWAFFHAPSVEERVTRSLGGLGATVEQLEGIAEGDQAGDGLNSVENQDLTTLMSGRSWSAEELRQKSFKDLHTLWYILLRERNVLATQREERSRLGITLGNDLLSKRTFRCRKSMARIKYVLNERRLALLAAAESTRPTDSPKVKVPGKSPLGAADPLSLSGFEKSEDRVQWYRGHGEALGDGERQKEDQLEEKPVAVPEEDVSKEEVEARDEGFGSGKEAKEFVKEMEKKE